MQQKELMQWSENKTKFVIYLLIALYLLLFLPFWQPVLLGFLFAAACAPLVNKVRHRFRARRSRIAYLTVALGLILFIGFVTLVALQVYSQLYDLFQDKESLSGFNEKIGHVRDQILSWAESNQYLQTFHFKERLDRAVVGLSNSITKFALAAAQGFVSRAPEILMYLFIFIASYGAFLVIQPRIWSNMSNALGLGDRGQEHFQRFEKICALALGSVLLTAAMQAALVVVGASIAGFGGQVMIFAIAFILAMIPVIGAGAVPVALCIFSFLQGETSHGFIMLVTSVIVSISDNILRAWLFSRAAESNPAISIISLLGGIALFGFTGLFIAPVLEQLVMTYAFSGEGEPQPQEATVAREPTHPDRFVEGPRRRDDLRPRPT